MNPHSPRNLPSPRPSSPKEERSVGKSKNGEFQRAKSSVREKKRKPSAKHPDLLSLETRLAAEITKRQAVEQTLRESEERYRLLIQTMPDVIYELDSATGILTFLNPSFEAVTGWSVSDWIGKIFVGLLHPDDVPRAMKIFGCICKGEVPEPHELRILCKGGYYIPGEFTSIPQIRDGRVYGNLGIAHNINRIGARPSGGHVFLKTVANIG